MKDPLLAQTNMDKVFLSNMFKKNKLGISSIIATLLLIVLTVVLIAVVWGVVNSLVKGKISQSSACFGNFEEVKLSQLYSCYDSSLKQVHVSLNIGNIDADGVLVSISGPSQTKSFTITNTLQNITNLANYDRTTLVQLPGKNSGATYIYNWTDTVAPNSMQIAPLISGQQCSVSDTISSLESCALL